MSLWLGAAYLIIVLPGPVSLRTFWLGVGILVLSFLGGIFCYWSWAFASLRYTFDRNGLTLHWGGLRQVVPMNQIVEVRQWQEGERVAERGLRWPGYHRGRGRSHVLGEVHFYATAGRDRQLLIRLDDETYVISPRDVETFVQEVELRRNLGVTRQLQRERQLSWLLRWSIWRDARPWLLAGLAFLINLSLFGYIFYRYPTLPALIPMHYSVIGDRFEADIIGFSRDLFKLPVFGFLVLGGNFSLGVLLHREHRSLVMVLQVVALVVQVAFWVGSLFILFS
jgi:hypothetical protein